MGNACAHPDIRSQSSPFGCGWIDTGYVSDDPGRNIGMAALKVQDMGIYRVTVQCTGETRALFGQRRNLIAFAPARETSFYTCLTEYIPSMSAAVSKDSVLYASAAGGRVLSVTAEKAEAPCVFIAGDSTVADQSAPMPYYPFDAYAGWGQMLPAFLSGMAVCNQAHSGMTGRCFMEDGHFGIVRQYLRRGDILLLQFGHNDQKRRALQPSTGYTAYLKSMISEAKRAGAAPVLLSPVSRVPGYDVNGAFDLLADYAQAAQRLALAEGIPYIDLHRYTFDQYVSLGEDCRLLFKPGDMTHANDRGAFRTAAFAARKLAEYGLVSSIAPDMPDWFDHDMLMNPAKTAPVPLPAPYMDADGVPDKEIIRKAVQKGLLDPCVLHMHPFAPLPRAQFMHLLFRAAHIRGEGTNGVRPYLDIGPYEWDSGMAMQCRTMGLVTGDRFLPDKYVTGREANAFSRLAGYTTVWPDTDEPLTRYEIVRELSGWT